MSSQSSSIVWAKPAVPRHVIQFVVVDEAGRVILLHRSNTVRSARNVWSFPSGMHDIGKTATEIIAQEMREELGLDLNIDTDTIECLGQYENIAGDVLLLEQWHWVITMYMVTIQDCGAAVNMEPSKHDRLVLAPMAEVFNSFVQPWNAFGRWEMHPSIWTWMEKFSEDLHS